MKKVVRVLSIDGGGVRGLIPALVLQEIEKRTGKPISELFDLIGGASTGGILALGLTTPDQNGKPKYTATQMVDFYITRLSSIFYSSLFRRIFFFLDFFRPKYSPAGLEKNTEMMVGNTRLSDALTEILIPAYEIEKSKAIFFKSKNVKNDKQEDFYMKDIIMATSAAPTFFPAAKIKPCEGNNTYYMIDGSTFASDPAMCSYAEAKNIYPEMESVILISLGTGRHSKTISYKKARRWGSLFWAVPVLNILFDGMPDTVDYQLKKILNVNTAHQQYFFRLQVELDGTNDSLDDASDKNLNNLKVLTQKMIEDNSSLIDEMCRILTDKNLS